VYGRGDKKTEVISSTMAISLDTLKPNLTGRLSKWSTSPSKSSMSFTISREVLTRNAIKTKNNVTCGFPAAIPPKRKGEATR
jgi:hypothetical protein